MYYYYSYTHTGHGGDGETHNEIGTESHTNIHMDILAIWYGKKSKNFDAIYACIWKQ